MSDPIHLIAYGNTYNPSLLILQEKGYRLEAEEGSNSLVWYAFKDDDSYQAYSPPELLGLVVLGETFGKDWCRQTPSILRKILSDPPDASEPAGGSN